MLWIEKYRPATFEEIVGHDRVVKHLQTFAASGSLPHLMISGPHGTGKSVAVECVAKRLYGDHWIENCTVMHASDLFLLGKKYLEEDDRYAHIYRKDESLINNFKHIIRWYASLQPLDAPFKMMVIDDASALTRDAQSSLRRTMERYSKTCRFVFCTTHPAAIIPAIASRCIPFFFGPVSPDLASACLRGILAKEKPERCCTDDEIDLIVQDSGGDLRRSVMLLQVAAESGVNWMHQSYDYTHIETTRRAAVAAYKEAGIKNPREELSLMEVHDCFSITEMVTYEDLMISPEGKAGEDIESGFYNLDGKLPCQSDGGLKCFGHPIGASGLRMLYEVYKQLQGKAGPRQIKDPKLGLTHNVGGQPTRNVCFVSVIGK
jgi:replication factor C small subunit